MFGNFSRQDPTEIVIISAWAVFNSLLSAFALVLLAFILLNFILLLPTFNPPLAAFFVNAPVATVIHVNDANDEHDGDKNAHCTNYHPHNSLMVTGCRKTSLFEESRPIKHGKASWLIVKAIRSLIEGPRTSAIRRSRGKRHLKRLDKGCRRNRVQ